MPEFSSGSSSIQHANLNIHFGIQTYPSSCPHLLVFQFQSLLLFFSLPGILNTPNSVLFFMLFLNLNFLSFSLCIETFIFPDSKQVSFPPWNLPWPQIRSPLNMEWIIEWTGYSKCIRFNSMKKEANIYSTPNNVLWTGLSPLTTVLFYPHYTLYSSKYYHCSYFTQKAKWLWMFSQYHTAF